VCHFFVCFAVRAGGVIVSNQAPVQAALVNCTVISADVAAVCVLPAGVGRVSQLSLTVLDVVGVVTPDSMWYDPPVLATTVPTLLVLPSDMSLVVTIGGSGFGFDARAVTVWITVNSSGICGATNTAAIVNAASIVISDDSSMSVRFNAIPFVFGHGSLYVVVSDQEATRSFDVLIASPVVYSLSFAAERPNSTLYYIDVVGNNFGAFVDTGDSGSSCVPQGAVVTVDDVRCLSVVMIVVSAVVSFVCVWYHSERIAMMFDCDDV
jgi:hypothetical protein